MKYKHPKSEGREAPRAGASPQRKAPPGMQENHKRPSIRMGEPFYPKHSLVRLTPR